MNQIEEQRNVRWQVLFRLYELHKQKPGVTFLSEELGQLLPDSDIIDLTEAVVYLSDKGLAKARFWDQEFGVPIFEVRISGYGIDQVEEAIKELNANLKKRPVGFERWHVQVAAATQACYLEGSEIEQ